jgi:hypothetical protein
MAEKKRKHSAAISEFGKKQICFGLDRPLDERSLIAFMEILSTPDLLHVLVPRLEDEEILAVVDFFTGLMKKHLSHEEYHRLFLSGPQP